MPNTVPYSQFPSAVNTGSDFWGCVGGSCTVTAHITNATLGLTDFFYVDAATIQGSIQATQFIGQQVSFLWKFDTCTRLNGYATILISGVSTATTPSADIMDLTAPCPAINNAVHAGTVTVGSDGIVTLSLSPQKEDGNVRDSAYFGNFIFQLTGNTAINPSTASSSRASSVSSASTSASVSTAISGSTTSSSSGASTSSLSRSTTLTGSQLSEIPSLVPSWTPGQTASLPGSSPGVGSSGESPPGNKGAIIGGAVAGVAVAIIALVALWLYLRKRRTRQGEGSRIQPLSHDESGWGGAPGTGKWMELRPIESNTLQIAEKDPNLLSAATTIEPLSVSSEGDQPTPNAEASRRPPSVMFSNTGLPTYDSHENANQNPFFLTDVGDQRGPYTLDDTFRVHDLLGEWAEEHRDAIPYHLERRLRIGGYIPGTDPNEIHQEVWLSRFDVTRFELAGLVELFERTNGMPTHGIAI